MGTNLDCEANANNTSNLLSSIQDEPTDSPAKKPRLEQMPESKPNSKKPLAGSDNHTNVLMPDEKEKARLKELSPPPTPKTPKSNMTREQAKYCAAIMRTLKRHRDAGAFLRPVDAVRLNLPDYHKVIKHPMDFGTIDTKLSCGEYEDVNDFIYDVRLVFKNCYKFNGPEAMISMLCQNVESAFEKSLRQMPLPKVEPLLSEKTTKSGAKRKAKEKFTASESSGRSKRAPRSKDYPEPMTKRVNPRKQNVQMKFCGQVLRELKKAKHRNINYPFLEPVDVVALNIPDYPTIVKHPMDLSTIERKLQQGEYETPSDFEADIRLMFNNCYLYNPPMVPVHKMGRELERVFDEKWKEMPPLPPPEPPKPAKPAESSDESDVDDDGDDDDKLARLERYLKSISKEIESMKSQRKGSDRSANKGGQGRGKTARARPKKQQTAPSRWDHERSRRLADQVNQLTGEPLDKVVEIIQAALPIQAQGEIELDMNLLDDETKDKLNEIVMGIGESSEAPATQSRDGPSTANHDSSDSDSSSLASGDSDSDGSDSDSD